MAGFFLPAGYQMTLTADDYRAGSYSLFGVEPSGYTEVDVGDSAVVGPFAVPKQYDLTNLTVTNGPVLFYSAQDYSDIKDSLESSGLDLAEGQTYKIDGEDVAPAANMVAKNATDASEFSFVVDEDNMVSDDDTLLPTQQSVKAYVDTSVTGMITSSNDVTDLTPLDETNIPAISDAGELALIPITIGTVNDILDVLIAAGLMAAPE